MSMPTRKMRAASSTMPAMPASWNTSESATCQSGGSERPRRASSTIGAVSGKIDAHVASPESGDWKVPNTTKNAMTTIRVTGMTACCASCTLLHMAPHAA